MLRDPRLGVALITAITVAGLWGLGAEPEEMIGFTAMGLAYLIFWQIFRDRD